jgi:putative membrane protein
MMYDWGPGWGGMFFGPLGMIALVVLSVGVIVAALSWLTSERSSSRAVGSRTPREILDERFAKGEIDREDYDARRKALGA